MSTQAPHAAAAPRTLAEELRTRSDARLQCLFAARPDLADPVPVDTTQVGARATERASVVSALDRLDRLHLAVLAAVGRLTAPVGIERVRAAVDAPAADVDRCVDDLHAAALVWGVPGAYRVVREAREILRDSGEPLTTPVAHPPAVRSREVGARRVAQLCAGTALDLVRRADQLLGAWGEQPPLVLASGGVGVRDIRTTAALLDVGAEETEFLIDLLRRARLLDRLGDGGDRVWVPTTAFESWRERPIASRWCDLAEAWLLSPGRWLRGRTLTVLGSVSPQAFTHVDDVVAAVAWYAPRAAEHRDSVHQAVTEAAWLGMTARNALSPVGAAIDADAVATTTASPSGSPVLRDANHVLDDLLPPPVDHVTLQGDLTAVAPGPLEHGLARRLEEVADVESRGGATVYRFSPTSLRRALQDGWSAADIHEFLDNLSSTRVPQPLRYLVGDLARVSTAEPAPEHDAEPRAPRRAPVTPVPASEPVDPTAVVSAVRSGDESQTSNGTRGPARSETVHTLAVLRDAVEAHGSVRLGYMNPAGTRSERLVDPLRVDAGWLTAYDHRTAQVQRFALHRVTNVGDAPAEATS